MTAHDFFDPSVVAMSNYSVYFLRQNAHLDINCSVYSLTLGLLKYQDYSSGIWLGNILNFVPAYYVTNCLVPELWAQIASQNVSMTDIEVWLDEYRRNPYNVADNGDSFVALLFTLVGLCVSCWMLLLLFLLLPKHKQKPVLTQLAVLFYLIYLTVIFSQVANITELEYYADLLDMIRILTSITRRRFAIIYLLLNFLTQLAYLQLFLEMTKNRWKLLNCTVVSLVIIATLITGAFFIPLMSEPQSFLTMTSSVVPTLQKSLKTLFMTWFAVCLARYTLFGTATPPKQVSYSRKLAPLALLTWLFIFIHIVLTLLLLTLWRESWLISSWLSFIPSLLSIYILTTSWEWLYSIRHLELRLEIVDMLGRRISLEDVMDFNNDEKVKRTAFRGRFESLLSFFRGHWRKPKVNNTPGPAFSGTTTSSIAPPIVVDCGQTDATLPYNNLTRDDESSEYQVHYMDTDSWEESRGLGESNVLGSSREAEFQSVTTDSHVNEDLDPEMAEGTSSAVHPGDIQQGINDELPPFRPHPGFSKDDYWDEK